VYDAHCDRVWRFVVSVVGRQDADDVFQETWITALRAYPDLRDIGAITSWLLTIAQRKGIDEHRARRQRPTLTADPPQTCPTTPPYDDDDGDDALWQLVRDLPPKQRAALAHRFVGDLAYHDIAAAMGTTPEAARRNVHEAITKLRSTWAP